MSDSENLRRAKEVKNDEFYTRLVDIQNELKHYKQHLKDKVIYCNCDNPKWSAFWEYFHTNFAALGLKKLIATYYSDDEPAYKTEYTGGCDEDITVGARTQLNGYGDFRSDECVTLIDTSDIVITNPPFSMFREFVDLLMKHDKKFLVIGSKNAISYKDFFPLIKDGKVWTGNNDVRNFIRPDGTIQNFGHICWFTNLDTAKRNEELALTQRYYGDDGNPLPDVEARYPHYDNYDAISISKTKDIPRDYFGLMGVPITFIEKYNPSQFEIIGADHEYAKPIRLANGKLGNYRFYINGKRLYSRILIKRKG